MQSDESEKHAKQITSCSSAEFHCFSFKQPPTTEQASVGRAKQLQITSSLGKFSLVNLLL